LIYEAVSYVVSSSVIDLLSYLVCEQFW